MGNDTHITSFGRLLHFLDQLEGQNIHYTLKHVRDSIMVVAFIPAGIWEIEFFEDGTLEVEVFRRADGVDTVPTTWVDEFIEQNTD